MGRANVYLPDELERRVRAAKLPVSEICQRALLTAVETAEATETEATRFGTDVASCYRIGREAGADWAADAEPVVLLTLLRDQQLTELPRAGLPEAWYSWTDEQTLAWEAGFVDAARGAVRTALASEMQDGAGSATSDEAIPAPSIGDLLVKEPGTSGPTGDTGDGGASPLGDTSRSYVGVDRDGNRVAFDPHAALEAGRSPLFAVLGPADQRARLTFGIGQDAAARGSAVVVLDLSGALTPRARGLGRNVRVVRPTASPLPGLEDLLRGGGNLRSLWETVAGLSGSAGLLTGGADDVVKPGYVTVLSPSGDGALSGALSAAQAIRTLTGLGTVTDHPRLLLVDLPTGVSVPGALAGVLQRLVGTVREHRLAFGLSAESAEAVTGVGGSGALLSTVFGFTTTSPVEADRLRDLLGASAPVLLAPPGSSTAPTDEAWAVMRDLFGRLGQVRIDSF